MSFKFRACNRVAGLAALLAASLVSFSAGAQMTTLQCLQPATAPPSVPATGVTEILGDLIAACTYGGVQVVKNTGHVRTTEALASTGTVTNQFSDSGDPLGVGIVAGVNLALRGGIVIGPFVSVDWLRQTINRNFTGGQFLGTTTHWIVTAGAKAGVAVMPSILVYGLAGAAWLNHDLNINFATAASRNTTTPGFTLGIGGEFQPNWLQQFGVPMSLFVQYQHTWWDTAHFNTPSSSPLFNYAFRREDDTIKFGFNVYF